ncbi:hypothetical protein [Nocardioides salsibiostraticola]
MYLTEFKQGRVFSDAFVRVILTGQAAGTLRSVEVIGGDGYFEMTGLKVAGKKRKFGSVQLTPRYPPTLKALGPLVDGEGAKLTLDEAGGLLIIGTRVTRDGIGSRAGLRVRYSVDGTDYYQDLPAAIVNCPPGTDSEACDDAYEQGFDDAVELAG